MSVFEDNEAATALTLKKRARALRRGLRTHRVVIVWFDFFGRHDVFLGDENTNAATILGRR